MLNLFRAFSKRLREMFTADVAQEFETHLAIRQADRRAELYQRAAEFDSSGLHSIAASLRERADLMSVDTPILACNWEEQSPKLLDVTVNGNGTADHNGEPQAKKRIRC